MPEITVIAGSDLFAGPANVLVNTVNTVGAMGAGLAKQFRNRYPEIDCPYRADCRAGNLTTGTVAAYQTRCGKTVLCFPTKAHWRQPSRLEYITSGLTAMQEWTQGRDGSDIIAIPPLGCGLGGLRWPDIKPLIVDAAGGMNARSVIIYKPARSIRQRQEATPCRE